MSDLATTEGVLEWAEGVRKYPPGSDGHVHHGDRTTAAELAGAMRVLVVLKEIVAEADDQYGWSRFDGTNHERDIDRLRDAMGEGGGTL